MITPEYFDLSKPFMPKDLMIPEAILFKKTGCGWCDKMTEDWNKLRQKVAFIEMSSFVINDTPQNHIHFEKIQNCLKDPIDGFPCLFLYKDDQVEKHLGYKNYDDLFNLFTEFVK